MEDMETKIRNKYLFSEETMNAQLWVNSVFGATAAAFLFSLIGGVSESLDKNLFWWSTLLFSIALVFNVSSAFFIVITEKNAELYWKMHKFKPFSIISSLSAYVLPVALLLFIASYDWIISVIFFVFFIFTSFSFIKAMSSISRWEREEFKKSIEVADAALERYKKNKKS